MKIVVIGAGLIGLATAHYLEALGHDVVVIDRRDGPALETSFANAGMLTPSQAEPWNVPGILAKVLGWLGREDAPVLLRPAALPAMLAWTFDFLRNSSRRRFVANALANAALAGFSVRELRELRKTASLDYGEIRAGTLKVYRDRAALDEGAHVARMLADAGVVQHFLDAAAAVALEPALSGIGPGLVGAIHFPDDESGDAHRFCRALAQSMARRRVDLRFNVDVTGFAQDGGRVTALRTTTGDVAGEVFVLCAGSYSPRLVTGLGIRIPIRPVKGYSITIPMAVDAVAPRIAMVDDTRHAALTPMDGRLRIAGTAEFAGYDTVPTASRIGNLVQVVREVLPGHVPGPGVELNAWAGLRPYCSDGVPVIGRSSVSNLWINAGHGHLGWTLAAGSGKLLAQLLSGVSPGVDPAPYRPDRF